MKDLLNKLDEKFWSPIQVPTSMNDLLGKLTKGELTNIRKSLNLKGASTLKKEELVHLISQEFISRSHENFFAFDEDVYDLVKYVADQNGWVEASSLNSSLQVDQVIYLRNRGILFPGNLDGQKVLVMANEMRELFIAADGPELQEMIQQNTYWVRMIQGLLYYYGVLTPDQLTDELYKRDTIAINDVSRFSKVLDLVQKYYGKYQVFAGGLAHPAVANPIALLERQEQKKELSFYPFTKEQLIRAGITGYKDKNEAFLRFSGFLTGQLGFAPEIADSITEKCVLYIREGGSLQPLMDYIGKMVKLDGTLVKPLIEELVYLSNHSRQWVLKGYTPAELLPSELNHLQKGKIGRNDPCVCGSGKKYKKCCLGKR